MTAVIMGHVPQLLIFVFDYISFIPIYSRKQILQDEPIRVSL